MKRVVVVGTYHSEAGPVTVDALESIVTSLRPDVLFLECPPEALEDYLSRAEPSLESGVAARLQASGRVQLVPVDLPTPSARFFWNQQELIRRVESRNLDYCALVDLGARRTRESGLAYLNSAEFDSRWDCIDVEVRETVARFRDTQLMESLDEWSRQNERREEAMIEAIDTTMKQGAFERGVLLVGAAHRRSIREKVTRRPEAVDSPSWLFWAPADK
jgi:hypothetical protein